MPQFLNTPAEPEPHLDPRAFQARRLVQITIATLLALTISIAQHLISGQLGSAGILALSLLPVFLALQLALREKVEHATAAMAWTLTAAISAVLWIGQGVRDPGLLAYPGVLIFAGMLGGRRLFFALLGAMLLGVGLMVAGEVQGWHRTTPGPVEPGTFIHLAAILCVLGFSIWLMAGDLRRALHRLALENERVVASQEHVAFLAHHDTLTGLPNRVLTRDRFEQTISRCRREQSMTGLLYLDLDNFKSINDSLGHNAGDELLKDVAKRLRETVRATDTVCRQGGDEFLIALGEVSDADGVASIAVKVLEKITQPFTVQNLELTVTCSLGIALSPDDGADFDTLLKKADMAMYRAKEAGRNAFRFFDAEMNSSVVEHLHLTSAMRLALQRQEFMLYYQPQFDLLNGHIIGAEALLRWRHPELGLIPPARFIPVAERSGMIIELGAWVLQEACREAKRWLDAGLPALVVSVNLSPVQFMRGDIERVVINALDGSGLPPTCIELELTESLLIEDSQRLTESLKRLRQLGASFSIDDFGTGYSNLGYLKRFEVERLKIDQSFVRRLCERPQDEAIVRAIIQMAHSLQLQTVAEGIEDQATLERLIGMGCDRGQGYYWSPAVPAPDFVAMVQKEREQVSQ